MTKQQFAHAYEAGFHQTVRFLISKGVPVQSAEEAAQAGWVQGWEHRIQLHDPEKIGNWINTISLNAFRNSMRRDRLLCGPVERSGRPQVNAATLDVQSGLARCDPSDRKLLIAYYVNGYTSGEIAHALDCSSEAIRVRVFRAKRRLIEYLVHPEAVGQIAA